MLSATLLNQAGTNLTTTVPRISAADGTPPRLDWVIGDEHGMEIPAHAAALRAGGPSFLTAALHAGGVLAADNAVTAITCSDEFSSGGTGRKMLLSVAYRQPQPGLYQDLFVKFSRDFDDAIRDRPRHMMQAEVWFAELSQMAGFPVTVPACYFADFHQETGTGILVTQRISFGSDGIELFTGKCLDYEKPDVLPHYQAIFKTLARLAGTHKAGHLGKRADERFPFSLARALANDRLPYDAARLRSRVDRYAEFAIEFPQLLPPNIRSTAFIARLRDDVALFADHEMRIRRFLYDSPDLIALCHWNANIDNAWFWRGDDGELRCGLMDWGRVGQMNLAAALYGSLSGAEPKFWDNHLDSLLMAFADEYARCGAPRIDLAQLKLHLHLFTATMGLAYIMDAPRVIRLRLPDVGDAQGPHDSRFKASESARTQLHMITMLLHQWQTHGFGSVLEKVLKGSSQ
jgi:hypothetical protein